MHRTAYGALRDFRLDALVTLLRLRRTRTTTCRKIVDVGLHLAGCNARSLRLALHL